MSTSNPDTDATTVVVGSGQEEGTGNETSETRNLSDQLCRTEVDILKSEDQAKLIVTNRIMTAAFALKDEIVADLDLKGTEEKLIEYVKQLKISHTLLTTLCSDEAALTSGTSRSNFDSEKIKTAKETALRRVNEILKKINDIEEKLNGMNDCWEYFKDNYKKEVLKTINGRIAQMQANNEDKELQWKMFLPQMTMSGQESQQPFNYYG